MAYKDSLFRSIFANEKSALALCDAVLGTSHSGGNPQVVMNTLGETLWTPRKNDLSFILNDCLVVIVEHQSTINENMPYRMLQYICRLFDNDISDRKAIYRQARIELLRPIFIVLYNGPTDFPDRKILRLSDAFRKVPGFEGISLELEVYVYNVNEGRNRSIMESCAELKGYAYFVSRVRRHEADLLKPGTNRREATIDAIRLAVRDCKRVGLLNEYWENLSQEDMNMLVAEWDMETALEVREEEGFERGREEGREEGMENMARNALAKGLPLELICEITGLDPETIAGLQASV